MNEHVQWYLTGNILPQHPINPWSLWGRAISSVGSNSTKYSSYNANATVKSWMVSWFQLQNLLLKPNARYYFTIVFQFISSFSYFFLFFLHLFLIFPHFFFIFFSFFPYFSSFFPHLFLIFSLSFIIVTSSFHTGLLWSLIRIPLINSSFLV